MLLTQRVNDIGSDYLIKYVDILVEECEKIINKNDLDIDAKIDKFLDYKEFAKRNLEEIVNGINTKDKIKTIVSQTILNTYTIIDYKIVQYVKKLISDNQL